MRKAIELLRAGLSKKGFVASTTDIANYKRIWGRDSMVVSLAALQSGNKTLVQGVKHSIETLLSYLHPAGFLPESVGLHHDPEYGETVGRVDSALWVIFLSGQYYKKTNDIEFILRYYNHLKKMIRTAESWEFNGKHLIYVPQSGDWADEFLHHGYILYDQVIYYLAMREFEFLSKVLDRPCRKRAHLIRKTIAASFDFSKKRKSKWIYNQRLYDQEFQKTMYPVASFTPSAYSTQFDGLGIALLMHCDIYDDEKKREIHEFVKKEFHHLLPAYYPIITEDMLEWKSLTKNYYYKFSNKPYQYHNGGLWPFITGIYASALQKNQMRPFLKKIKEVNAKDNHGFYEYFHGLTEEPMGTKNQLWSAAGELFVEYALKGKKLIN